MICKHNQLRVNSKTVYDKLTTRRIGEISEPLFYYFNL